LKYSNVTSLEIAVKTEIHWRILLVSLCGENKLKQTSLIFAPFSSSLRYKQFN